MFPCFQDKQVELQAVLLDKSFQSFSHMGESSKYQITGMISTFFSIYMYILSLVKFLESFELSEDEGFISIISKFWLP